MGKQLELHFVLREKIHYMEGIGGQQKMLKIFTLNVAIIKE
jgi:hypothetical protein